MTSPGPGVGSAWAELHAHFVAEIAASELHAGTSTVEEEDSKVWWSPKVRTPVAGFRSELDYIDVCMMQII